MRGTVKFYNIHKRYGFIRGEDGREYFVHEDQIFLAPYLERAIK